jgi:hypothetical protein
VAFWHAGAVLADPSEFPAARGYLDTASVGLPPCRTLAAMRAALDEWGSGRARPQDQDVFVERSRAAFARIVDVSAGEVAIGANVSSFAGAVAASLPSGAEVLVADGDFTSILFPFLVARRRGVRVTSVPLDRIVESIRASTDLVVVSRRPVVRRDIDRPARAGRRSRRPRRAHFRRPDAGGRLVPGRGLAVRLDGVRRVQVAALAAWRRVLHRAVRTAR